MRRAEKQITEIKEIEKIIHRAQVCRLGMSLNNIPYIVPMNFGYKDDSLYFHSAKEGKKIDILTHNPNICFEIDLDNELVPGNEACKWTMKYISIMGTGKAQIIENPAQKEEALNIIMAHYTDKTFFQYNPKAIDAVKIIKVSIDEMIGKKSGY